MSEKRKYVRGTVQERIAVWAVEDHATGCLIWTGARTSGGYGQITIRRRAVQLHRFTWEAANGPIPAGMCVCHTCDRPACLALGHLFLGTQADNNADKVAKGRQARGENHGHARFSDEQIARVHDLAARGMNQTAIGREIGMSRQHVGSVLYGLRRA